MNQTPVADERPDHSAVRGPSSPSSRTFFAGAAAGVLGLLGIQYVTAPNQPLSNVSNVVGFQPVPIDALPDAALMRYFEALGKPSDPRISPLYKGDAARLVQATLAALDRLIAEDDPRRAVFNHAIFVPSTFLPRGVDAVQVGTSVIFVAIPHTWPDQRASFSDFLLGVGNRLGTASAKINGTVNTGVLPVEIQDGQRLLALMPTLVKDSVGPPGAISAMQLPVCEHQLSERILMAQVWNESKLAAEVAEKLWYALVKLDHRPADAAGMELHAKHLQTLASCSWQQGNDESAVREAITYFRSSCAQSNVADARSEILAMLAEFELHRDKAR